MKHSSLILSCALASLLILSVPSFAQTAKEPATTKAPAASASSVVQKFYDSLQDTMRKGETLGFQGRYQALQTSLNKAFNFPTMARFVVGPSWISTSKDLQEGVTQAFANFSIASYASQFIKDGGEKFEILNEKPATGGGIIVATTLSPSEGDPVALNYLMRLDDKGAWRIVDVFLDGTISQLATRRSEFNAILQDQGADALIQALKDKTQMMGSK